MKEDSGRLWLADRKVHYQSSTYASWSLDVTALRLVGECTNQNGPFTDDYFLVFLVHGSDDWWEASFYAEGCDLFLAELRNQLPGLGLLGLAGSTDFKSRVLWPPVEGDLELFDYKQVKRGGGALNRILDWIVSGSAIAQELRQEWKVCPAANATESRASSS